MSRRSRARLVHVAGPVLVLAGLAVLAAWLGPKLRSRHDSPHRAGPSLLVLENVAGPSGTVDAHRLLRFGAGPGGLTTAETVWEGGAAFFGHRGPHHLLADRYVVGASGGVIDIRADGVVHEPNGELLEVADGRVVFRGAGDRAVYTFDPEARKLDRLRGAERKYALPGVRSPGGLKSVEDRGTELVLHVIQQRPVSLGTDFHVGQSPLSSNAGNPPVLWLDDGRFLTQVSNGVLVVVALDGTRTPAVTVPARQDVIGAPRLTRDGGGGVVYECGPDAFLIDADAGAWERCDWVGVGYGFEASREAGEDGHTIRYQGREIGRVHCQPQTRGHVAAADGHVALLSWVSQPDGTLIRNQVRMWSAATGAWATAEPPRPAYLIGWAR